MDPLESVLQIFREEAEDLLDRIAEAILSLRLHGDVDPVPAIEQVLRDLHSLKGAASSVGNAPVEQLAHAAEDALVPLRAAGAVLDGSTLDALEAAVAAMGLAAKGEPPRDLNSLVTSLGGRKPLLSTRSVEPTGPCPTHQPTPPSDPSTSLRVSSERLDQLLNYSAELSILQARQQSRNETLMALQKELRELSRNRADDPVLVRFRKQLDQVVQRDRRELLDFAHLTIELREGIRHLRMIPLRSQEATWRSTVRETAATLDRKARLQCRVGGLALDKVVLDALHGPMVHLLRNAVAHGIEPEEARLDAGKPREGLVQLEAHARGAMIELAVSDDGGGIDWDRVTTTAVERGVVSASQAQQSTAEQLAQLLFAPGFSTSVPEEGDPAVRIRGRGIGLDVVRSQLRALGGDVTVARDPVLGGATFVCAVPASVVSTQGLLVGCRGVQYALPIENVQRTILTELPDLGRGAGRTVELPGDEPLRVVDLAALAGWTAESQGPLEQTRRLLVVLELSRSRLGVAVDQIYGQLEYMTQPLPYNYQGVPGVRGALVQPDGSVALALDVGDLFQLAQRRLSSPTAPARATQRVLVVDDSVSIRTLARDQLAAAGYEVAVAADGQEAWERLQQASFDLVISDVQMPNLDGLCLTRRMRETPRLADVPVILVSRLASAADRTAGAKAGADEYVVKGQFEKRGLIDVVQRYLGPNPRACEA